MELLGLVSLLGQRIPDAAAELLQELREYSLPAREAQPWTAWMFVGGFLLFLFGALCGMLVLRFRPS